MRTIVRQLVMALGLLILMAMVLLILPQQKITGETQVIDGDSLRINGTEIRLIGIDAPEFRQTCLGPPPDETSWACGRAATQALRSLLKRQGNPTCSTQGTDRFGRTLANCTLPDGRDVAAALVALGMATVTSQTNIALIRSEKSAQKARKGIWKGRFLAPKAFRDANK